MKNGIKNAIIPAVLLQFCAGSCYCFSIYRTEIGKILNVSDAVAGWMFTAVIFFLGMFAAFSGKMVEKDVHKSSLIAAILLPLGMCVVGVSLIAKLPVLAFIGFCVMGSGVGLSYVSPVKTLAIWYSKNKGLATSVSIASFGLSKSVLSPVMVALQDKFGTTAMFFILAAVFFISMFIGHIFLAKPDDWKEQSIEHKKVKELIFTLPFVIIFFMFWISISNGLCFIGYEKQLLTENGVAAIALVCSVTAMFNCIGRVLFSAVADKLKRKFFIYFIMAVINIVSTILVYLCIKFNILSAGIVIALLCIINATYGGFFAAIVPILAQRYNLNNLSTVHSCELVAWSLGAVTSTLLLQIVPGFDNLLPVMGVIYTVSVILGVIYIVYDLKNKDNELA